MNTELMRKWIEEHAPKGREKLAASAEVSVSLIDRILATGNNTNVDTARKIAKTIGVTLDELCSPPAA